MYRILPNPIFYIDKEYTIYKNGKIEIVNKNKDSLVTLELYGKNVTKPVQWFYKIAKFKIELPYELINKIDTINFSKFGKMFSEKLEYCVQSDEPLIIGKYAIPLALPSIAISKDCEVLDLHSRRILTNINSKYSTKFTNHYIKKYIHGQHVLLHRLMLDSWYINDNPSVKCVGNHKDGNKLNNKYDNLEWSSFEDNMKHAVKNGLRTDNNPVIIRHIKTFEIKKLSSIREMCKVIGIKGLLKSRIENMRLGETINNWEIRLENDKRDWYFITGDEPQIPTFATHSYSINGETFFNIRMLNEYLNLPLRTPIAKVKEKYTELLVTCLRDNSPYEIYVEKSKKHYKNLDIRTVVKITGFSISKIHRIVKNISMFINGFAIKKSDGDYWEYNTILEEKPNNFIIEVVDVVSGEVRTVKSAREGSKLVGISPKTIMKYIKNNEQFLNFKFYLKNYGPS